jgi:phospholipase C
MRKWIRRLPLAAAGLAVVVAVAATGITATASASRVPTSKTPIQHVVVIFQENVSFDHYFGTYPYATGTDGNPFTPKVNTPTVNGLNWSLLAANPNAAPPKRLDSSPTGLSGSAGGQLTCDMDHNYSDEQQAFDGGKMDQFVQSVGTASGTAPGTSTPCNPATVMDYYDGNTVTGLWNYAQNYAMSDNSFETTFGPSSPGAINLVSGNTGGVDMNHTANSPSISSSTAPNADLTADGNGGYSLTSDAQPYWDDCSTRDAVAMQGQNIGDLLNKAHLSWGWFQGGFAPTDSYQTALANVGASGQPTSTFIPDQFKAYYGNAANRPAHSSNQGNCDNVTPVGVALGGTGQYGYKDDYIPHHEPFQYYASTANPHHLPPASLSAIGTDTQSYDKGVPQFNTANHQYDTTNFDQLVTAITNDQLPASALPNVSFIKAPGYEDGHAAYSDPADEQQFVVHIINELEQSPDWSSTAVVINYDDSDGWYDHVYSGVTNPSASAADNLTNSVLKPNVGTSGLCGAEGNGSKPLGGEQGRCGFANRLPMLVISPYAKQNYVDSNVSDQSSIINFVEYNWGLKGIPGSFDGALAKTDKHEHIAFDLAGMFNFGAQPNLTPVLLDPTTGEVQ